MKRFLFAFTLVSLCWSVAFAQSEDDAFRYSMFNPGGTARFTAMGGAFGALGADFSTLSTNPAGLGLFRASEFSITPNLTYSSISSSYYGTQTEDMKYQLGLNNAGVVFSFPTSGSDQPGWKAINIGFGMNRHNNFNQRWMAEGFNTESSLMTDFEIQANEEGSLDNLDNYSTGLAWDTWLIFEDEFGFAVDMWDGQVMQRQETNSSGSVREFVMSLGANYNDRVYLGATFGIPTVYYEEESIFMESDVNNRNDVFNSLTYTNRFTTTGRGYNFKAGALVRVTDMIRVGAALHTPTFWSLEDEYRATMRSDLNLDDYDSYAESPEGYFEYELTTPLRALGSLGLVFGTAGILSLDYEYVDYSGMRLRAQGYSFAQENRVIEENYTAQHVVRLGGEINLNPVMLRAGYGLYTSPYVSGVNDGSQSVLSAGIGLRDRNYFIDLGYSLNLSEEDYYLYNAQLTQPVQKEMSMNQFVLTMGLRF